MLGTTTTSQLAAALRDEHLADLMQLFLADDCAGGHAYLMWPQDHHVGFAAPAFNTVHRQVAASPSQIFWIDRPTGGRAESQGAPSGGTVRPGKEPP